MIIIDPFETDYNVFNGQVHGHDEMTMSYVNDVCRIMLGCHCH